MSSQSTVVPEWARAEQACLEQMNAWVREAMERQDRIPWIGGTDESTFMLPWIPHYFLTGDEAMRAFMFKMRDRWYAWTRKNFHHGFFKAEAEEHHHTEDYKRFLARLWYMDPLDELNVRLIDHFAEHLGNWVRGVPEWYDWEKHRFRSRYIGTLHVNNDPQFNYNSPGFFRYVIVLIQAYLATGKGHYLDLCLDYADRWCDLLEATPEGKGLPMKVDADWNVIEMSASGDETGRGLKVGATWMSGGFTSTLVDLFLLAGRQRYALHAKRMLRFYCDDRRADAPMSAMLCGHVGHYRLVTGDDSFDKDILEGAQAAVRAPLPTTVQIAGLPPHGRLAWQAADAGPDARVGEGAANLAAAYQVSGDVKFIARSFQIAARCMKLARAIGDDSRFHGCANGSTLGIALRDVATSLYPATLGLVGVCQRGVSHHKVLATYRGPDGSLGLPGDVAALFRFGRSNERVVRLVNLGEASTAVRVVAHDGLMTRRERGVPWVISRQGLYSLRQTVWPWEEVASQAVLLQPGEASEVRIGLPAQDSA